MKTNFSVLGGDMTSNERQRFEIAARTLATLRAQRKNKFKILKFSSKIENFKRPAHETLFSLGNSEGQD